ncbi:hypothetical protein Zm00014a_013232 [Zea mays]|uniref:Uncharacterized protein n=1 Tax=Zea mays TaxID=4577 RepID=A0A3L6G5E7_MAIZE|nr:hypothetical protein Zm00014a_013232 [Zea mays]
MCDCYFVRRYRLLITAGDETGETDFILFERMAQRIVKKPLDILIADNPAGFIPDEITKLMEKVYTFNVSFTDSTIALGNVCFQVNTVVAEIGDGGQFQFHPVDPNLHQFRLRGLHPSLHQQTLSQLEVPLLRHHRAPKTTATIR